MTRYYKSYIHGAFQRWKAGGYKEVAGSLDGVTDEYRQTVQWWTNKINNTKDQNTSNCEHYFRKLKRNRVWFAWLKMRKLQKIRAYQKLEI
jgi:hypothetical protein